MRIILLGGTRFIGRAILRELAQARHEVLIIHRGQHVCEETFGMTVVHADRNSLSEVAATLTAFRADALIDTCAVCQADTATVLEVMPKDLKLVVLSSCDVYRAYGCLQQDRDDEPMPLDEHSSVRDERHPYRGKNIGRDDYEKLEVEELYLQRGGTVCRLPMVFGEHDYQRREEFVLRRIRAGRSRMPIGPGCFLWTRGYVGDIARGVRLAVESDSARGEIFNLGEQRTWSIRRWIEEIVRASGAKIELVEVPCATLPEDVSLTGNVSQHLLLDVGKAARVLGFSVSDAASNVARSVHWHLANRPTTDGDFSADDLALAAVR
jgi:nucleoside-diphosphate-sugar epimerase